MSKHLYAEIGCDYCGGAEHFLIDKVKKGFKRKCSIETMARQKGWIITSDGHHFDTKECYKNYIQRKKGG